jgi:coenzyme F420-0:L-glutamate ligase/coenzyme F420-1:gamma-L-glutamate ligase
VGDSLKRKGKSVIALHPLLTIGEVRPGDDLAAVLAGALAGFSCDSDDVLVVTQKIVSKAEDRFVDLDQVRPGPRATELAELTRKDPRLVELVLAESSDVVRAVPHVLITRHRSGHVMANAGIDRSNLGPGSPDRVLLLPLDCDLSARRLRDGLAAHLVSPPGVVISDSFGRPWRNGVINVALGVSGLAALIDRRGEIDRDGRELEVTQVAFGDLAASAAGLLMGEGAEGVPAVLIRGLLQEDQTNHAAALVRPVDEDLFR